MNLTELQAEALPLVDRDGTINVVADLRGHLHNLAERSRADIERRCWLQFERAERLMQEPATQAQLNEAATLLEQAERAPHEAHLAELEDRARALYGEGVALNARNEQRAKARADREDAKRPFADRCFGEQPRIFRVTMRPDGEQRNALMLIDAATPYIRNGFPVEQLAGEATLGVAYA